MSSIEATCLSNAIDGVSIGVVVVSVSVTSAGTPGPAGGVPCAVAVFTTVPAASSAAVTTYGSAVQLATAPGASVVGVHTTFVSFGSSTRTELSGTLPVLVTVKE